ncbi:MAG: TetR/AcrR family transcriptional regulator [Faecalibacterium sp.]|nr:TetR/AcrR family transcriptional regulator [Ruminococcus sp.]MCM1391540.1 TetR/AcrR family transcriptional regulator [Ruminococcus sp.]MCM1485497.1 TetR/AcrR family transcriptional regulator [Faecalibacterium sp.]
MGSKSSKATKSKIVTAAWKLFYENGYNDTTVDEIIAESGTSKGSFYHYFDGKDALLGSLAYLFDEKYTELSQTIDETMNSIDVLYMLNRELFEMIENRIDIDLLTRLYSTQLTTKGEKHLLDHHRVYYKLLRKIVIDGQQKNEITSKKTVSEIVRLYALTERALLYDWCLCDGEYSLKVYGQSVMGIILESLRTASE